jgi:hypothetical protein
MLGGLCLFLLEYGITRHECMGARKQSLMKGLINCDFATNSRELTFAKNSTKV